MNTAQRLRRRGDLLPVCHCPVEDNADAGAEMGYIDKVKRRLIDSATPTTCCLNVIFTTPLRCAEPDFSAVHLQEYPREGIRVKSLCWSLRHVALGL